MSKIETTEHCAEAELGLDAPLRFLKSASESDLTYDLKWAAWRWLYLVPECRSIGMEVRLEGPFGRVVDLVGVGKRNMVYIVEVKSSRADLKRDDKSESDRQRTLLELSALRESAEFTSKVLDDTRRFAVQSARGDSDWREDTGYVSARNDEKEINARIAAKERLLLRFTTKFRDPSFLACADFHYVMAPSGLITRAELPPLWGLLNEYSETVVSAVQKQVKRNTIHVLRAISKANTRDVMKACRVRIVTTPTESSSDARDQVLDDRR